jgi:hypothetical protein
LDRQQGGEQPDRSSAGDKDLGGRPRRPGADLFDVIPGLGNNSGRLEQYAEDAERGIDRHQVLGMNAAALAGIAVPRFRSVPQMPTARVWTKTGPSPGDGSGTSASATEPCRPGTTVTARMASP